MASVMAIIGKIASAIKKANEIAKVAKKGMKAKRAWDKYKKVIVSVLALFFLLPAMVMAVMLNSAMELKKMCVDRLWGCIKLSEQDVYESMLDANAFYEKLQIIHALDDGERVEAVLNMNKGLVSMDLDTLLLIVGEVAEYNTSISGYLGKRTVYTQYRKEKLNSGNWPLISDISGEFIVPEVQSGNITNKVTGLIIKGQGLQVNNPTNAPSNNVSGSPHINNNNNLLEGFNGWVSSTQSSNANTSGGSGFIPGLGLIPAATPSPAPTTPPVDIQPGLEVVVGEREEPTPTPEPEPNHKVTYPTNAVYIHSQAQSSGGVDVSIKDIEEAWDNGPNGMYEKMDKMDWQPLAALCCYYIAMTSDKWGTYTEPGDTYYISKAKVKELMDIYAFEYLYVQEVRPNTAESNSVYKFTDYINGDTVLSPFKTVIETEGKYRYTYRKPMFAPSRIANSYISYVYEYDKKREYLAEGGYIDYAYVNKVSYYVQPSRLLDAMKEKVPNFDKNMYKEILKIIPRSEEHVAYYENVILADNSEELQSWTTTREWHSPTINVVTGQRQRSEDVSGGIDINGGSSGFLEFDQGSTTIPLYAAEGELSPGGRYLNIKPHEGILAEGQDYGLYELRNDAYAPLTVCDMTPEGEKIGLEALTAFVNSEEFLGSIKNYDKSPILCTKEVRNDLAQALYMFQRDTGSSASGILAIIKQEGGFTSSIARNGYNYFNISPGRSWKYGNVLGFRDYKDAYEKDTEGNYEFGISEYPAVECFYSEAVWIYNNYWNKGQDTYYGMIFGNYGKDGTSGINAYRQISHSYCPPWDDTAMPYSSDSYTQAPGKNPTRLWKNSKATHRGWVNNCASYRAKYLEGLSKYRDWRNIIN